MEKHPNDGAVGVHLVSTRSFGPDSREMAVFTDNETQTITRHGFVLVPTPSDDPRDPLVNHFHEHYAEEIADSKPLRTGPTQGSSRCYV